MLALVALAVSACSMSCATSSVPGAAVVQAESPLGAFYAAEAEYTIALKSFIHVAEPLIYRPEVEAVYQEVAEFDELHARPIIIATHEAIFVAADDNGLVTDAYVENILFNMSNMVPNDSPVRAVLDSLLAAIQARQMPDAGVMDSVNAFLVSAERFAREAVVEAQAKGSAS
jgi:hypothetical protein